MHEMSIPPPPPPIPPPYCPPCAVPHSTHSVYNPKRSTGLAEFDLKPALAVGNEGTAVSKTAEAVEVWDLVLDDVQIPAGKLVAVVGQVCVCVLGRDLICICDLCP